MTLSTARRQAVARRCRGGQRRHGNGASASAKTLARQALGFATHVSRAWPQRCAPPSAGTPHIAPRGLRWRQPSRRHAAPAAHRWPPTHLISMCITRSKRPARRALTKPTQARRLRRAIARITGRYAPLEPLPMSSDSHPRPGSMTQLARA
ncbi:Hypothetical Protein XCAW_00222 [Xanthomonas citri subsp. citri Aw12879]|nr:Hypothetical Protein XCAW_00222 [Xanthomonas citri subsp. citri Aw12879]